MQFYEDDDLPNGAVPIDLTADVSRFTTEVPAGFNTALGHLASTNPEALLLMDAPEVSIGTDETELHEYCRFQNEFPIHRVPACVASATIGRTIEIAFPVEALINHFK